MCEAANEVWWRLGTPEAASHSSLVTGAVPGGHDSVPAVPSRCLPMQVTKHASRVHPFHASGGRFQIRKVGFVPFARNLWENEI